MLSSNVNIISDKIIGNTLLLISDNKTGWYINMMLRNDH